jgi:hypothetical protein
MNTSSNNIGKIEVNQGDKQNPTNQRINYPSTNRIAGKNTNPDKPDSEKSVQDILNNLIPSLAKNINRNPADTTTPEQANDIQSENPKVTPNENPQGNQPKIPTPSPNNPVSNTENNLSYPDKDNNSSSPSNITVSSIDNSNQSLSTDNPDSISNTTTATEEPDCPPTDTIPSPENPNSELANLSFMLELEDSPQPQRKFRISEEPIIGSPTLWDLIRMNLYLRNCKNNGKVKNHAFCVAMLYSLVSVAYRKRSGRFSASYNELAKIAGMSYHSAINVIKELQELGMICVLHNKLSHKPNLYILMNIEEVKDEKPLPKETATPVNNRLITRNSEPTPTKPHVSASNTGSSQHEQPMSTTSTTLVDASDTNKDILKEIRNFLSNIDERIRRLENKKSSFHSHSRGTTSGGYAPNHLPAADSSSAGRGFINPETDPEEMMKRADLRTLMVMASMLKSRVREYDIEMDNLKRDYGFASEEDRKAYYECRKKRQAAIARLNKVYDYANLPELKT